MTQEYLKKIVRYENGKLYWIVDMQPRGKI